MRFFPISYHSYEDKKGVCLVFFAYNESGEKVAIRFRYTHWFYANLDKHTYDEVQGFLSNLSTVHIDTHDPSRLQKDQDVYILRDASDLYRDKVNNAIQYRRSTVDQHKLHRVVRVHADSSLAKQEAMRILANHDVKVHEMDNVLSPLLKMMAEKNIRRYEWMEADIQMAAERITKFNSEYIGDLSTLRSCTEELPPPEFSVFSFDGEMNSTNWNRMPDAKSDLGNSIRVIGCTFKSKDVYKEHAIVYGPDVTNVYKEYNPSDIFNGVVHIHTFDNEIDAILKLFKLIEELDPDVITGHNIIAFDNQYINDRYKLLVMQGMSGKDSSRHRSIRIPNISRLKEHSVSVRNVEWNNSQVAVNGIYFEAPGRIWVDTLVVAARGLLGNLKNNKLDTLGKEILGMEKNEMHHKMMFKTFDLHVKWEQVKQADNDPILASKLPFKKKDIQDHIRAAYEDTLKIYNKQLPREVSNPRITHVNELIQLLNVMNQRGKKVKILSAKDVTSKTKEFNDKLKSGSGTVHVQPPMLPKPLTEDEYLHLQYTKYREECKKTLQAWNIPILPIGEISDDKMVQVLWYVVVLYCLQDTRIPYQVIDQQALAFMLREQSSTFSVDISDVLMRGQVFTTTSSQYRYNYQRGFMMDFGNQGGPIEPYEYEGGYVGKGTPGLKIVDNDCIIYVIDFASLYPTIIIAFNICYTTWVANDMRFPYIFVSISGEKKQVENPDYIWNRYKDLIPGRLSELKNELKELIDREIEVTSKDEKLKDKHRVVSTLLYTLSEEIDKRRQFYESQIDVPITKRDQYKGISYGDDIDRNLMYIAELECILAAPYERKGEYICSIFNVPNSHTKKMHVHWFLRPCVLPGVVPVMLWEQYLTRKVVKGKMSAAFKSGNIAMGITYNAQQDGIKRSMNATYGGFGTKTNRLANFAGAEVITWVGRESIQVVNVEVEKKGLGETVYNDTDSAMIRVNNITQRFGRDPQKIKEHGVKAAKELSNIFPKPMALECENFFVAYFLKGPKMYAAIKWNEKSVDIADYTWEYVTATGLLYIKGMVPVRRDKYTYSKELFMKTLYYILVRTDVDVLVKLLEYALTQIWQLKKGLVRGNKTDEQWRKYINNIERLFAYNMGVTAKASQGGDGTMAKWCNIYAQKYGRKPAPGERFELLVTNVGSGPDKHKHTRSPSKLVTMEWMIEEGRQLDVEHYISQLSNDGQVVEIMHIAYPEYVPRDCITGYYLKKLKVDGTLDPVVKID